MGKEIDLLDRYPKSKRPIDDRAALVNDSDRLVARKFGQEYFDGDRLTGYGGYKYHPRFWRDTALRFKYHYGLENGSSVLDVGCAKGFMMYDFKLATPGLEIAGVDISTYAKEHAKPEVADLITVANAKELPFESNSFDLVISINTLHNLELQDCKIALKEIERVSRHNSFVVNDAWRNEREKKAMLDWNLTALTYMHVDHWVDLFREVGYTGDYHWFFALSE